MEGESFQDLPQADIEKIKADEKLDKNDLVNMINETNDRDNNFDEEEFDSAAFTAKSNPRRT